MIFNFSSLFVLCVTSLPVLFLVLFLPTLIELKKPADTGPRMIVPIYASVLSQKSVITSILNIEDSHELDFLLLPLIAGVVRILPNLEP